MLLEAGALLADQARLGRRLRGHGRADSPRDGHAGAGDGAGDLAGTKAGDRGSIVKCERKQGKNINCVKLAFNLLDCVKSRVFYNI